MDKRFEKLQELLDMANVNIQNLHIQATSSNIKLLADAMTNIQIVYNTIGVMKSELKEKEESEDGTVPDPE